MPAAHIHASHSGHLTIYTLFANKESASFARVTKSTTAMVHCANESEKQTSDVPVHPISHYCSRYVSQGGTIFEKKLCQDDVNFMPLKEDHMHLPKKKEESMDFSGQRFITSALLVDGDSKEANKKNQSLPCGILDSEISQNSNQNVFMKGLVLQQDGLSVSPECSMITSDDRRSFAETCKKISQGFESRITDNNISQIHLFFSSELDSSSESSNSSDVSTFENICAIKEQQTTEASDSGDSLTLNSSLTKDENMMEEKELQLSKPHISGLNGSNGEAKEMCWHEAAHLDKLDCEIAQNTGFTVNSGGEVEMIVEPPCFEDSGGRSLVFEQNKAFEKSSQDIFNGSGCLNATRSGVEQPQRSDVALFGYVEKKIPIQCTKQISAKEIETTALFSGSQNAKLLVPEVTNSKGKLNFSILRMDDSAGLNCSVGEHTATNAGEGSFKVHMEKKCARDLHQEESTLVLLDSSCSSGSDTSSEEKSTCEIAEFLQNLSKGNELEEQKGTSTSFPLDDLPISTENESTSDKSKNIGHMKEDSTGSSVVSRQLKTDSSSVDTGSNVGMNLISHISEDDTHISPEKWKADTETENASSIFSGPIPYFGSFSYPDQISYSGTVSYSGPVPSYSGQIPYSGSISLRSDSSTTSTHSFAFPILASEWNSSPVKMPQPDRRCFQRKWRWRLTCFCCKTFN